MTTAYDDTRAVRPGWPAGGWKKASGGKRYGGEEKAWLKKSLKREEAKSGEEIISEIYVICNHHIKI